MTLMRGRFISYEYNRTVILFSMLDGEKQVPCALSTSAMDALEDQADAKPDQREAQFTRLRDRIETCVVGKYLASEFEGTPPRHHPAQHRFQKKAIDDAPSCWPARLMQFINIIPGMRHENI
ncbi:Protein of unknown function [Bradyrhizobium sp. Rc2d]|nr:Protein of unknown function [Bradyrhizobium sp. Rc2d]